jgi:DNA repair protein RadC
VKRRVKLGDGEPTAATRAMCAKPGGRSIQVCARWAKPGATVSSATAACKLLKSAAAADRESFYAIHLDVRHRSLGVEEVAKGGLASVEVHPREVFKSAILSNAAGMIIAHNHPSGDPSPSPQDIELTKRLTAAGQLLGIHVHDHVIVAAEGCTSMRERYGAGAMGFEGARETGPRYGRRRGRGGAALGVGAILLFSAAALALAART